MPLSHMALGLFCSLILGVILGQLAKIEALSFLGFIAETLSASSPLVGACIGMAIAYGMKCPLLVNVSSAIVGALGYRFGGPVGAYLAVASGCRAGLARIEAHSGRYNRHAAGHDRRRRYVRQVVLLADQRHDVAAGHAHQPRYHAQPLLHGYCGGRAGRLRPHAAHKLGRDMRHAQP